MDAADGLFDLRARPGVPSREDKINCVRLETMRFLRDERGGILALTALSMSILLSFLAFAIDVGNLFYTQRQLQTLADAAAMAGALEADTCGSSTPNCPVVQKAAMTAITEGGNPAPTLFVQCAQMSGAGLLLMVNNAPCLLGASDPNNTDIHYVEAVVAQQIPTWFAKIFGANTVTISARAEAGRAIPATGACMNVIGPAGQTLLLNSNASIAEAPGATCGIKVDSNGTPAVMENSNVTVNVSSYDVNGSVTANSNPSINPTPTTGVAPSPDPFAAEITAGTLTVPTPTNVGSAQSSNPIGGTTTLNPGYYQYGLNFNGGSGGYTVTLNPGVYYFGGGLNIGSNVTIRGTGVTIYMGGQSQLNMNSNTVMNLTAPSTGGTAGMVIWQAAGNTSQMNLNSNTGSAWNGAIYIPSARLTLNSNANVGAFGMIAAQSVIVNSNSSITLSCQYMPGGVCPGGGGNGANGGSQTIALAE
jgi:Putative Flp pilus-assembly TadE/G-like